MPVDAWKLMVKPDTALGLVVDTVRRGTPLWMRARGGSMGRAIPDASLVQLFPPRPVGLGDVVAVLTSAGRFFIHRVVDVRADGYMQTQGDALIRPDGWVQPEELVGVVLRVDRGRGPEPVRRASRRDVVRREIVGGCRDLARRLRVAP